MYKFNPEKLKVKLKNEISIIEDIETRKYTLTHSDETGELFLTIGKEYDEDSIDYKIRDEVLGAWDKKGSYYLLLSVQVDNGEGLLSTTIRDKIFREDLPLAITAIVSGDNLFLENNKELYDADILIKFNSDIKDYSSLENWGKVKDYKYNNIRDDEGIHNFTLPYNQNKFPLPGPIKPQIQVLNPYQYGNNKAKNRVIEDALITVLEEYIRSEVFASFGKNAQYCLKKAEVIEAKVINTYGPCTEEYEITIGLRVGKNAPFYNNMIITFIIDSRGIKVKNVKNPREV